MSRKSANVSTYFCWQPSYVSCILYLVLNYDSVTVCDGMTKQIQCPNNENIHVLQGFYGKWTSHNCKGETDKKDRLPSCNIDRKRATSLAREICQGVNTCRLISDKSIFGNPCPNSSPYLYVTFFCMAPGQKLNHQKTESNEEVVTVPSHGFVVEETRHIDPLTLRKQHELFRKKNVLPLSNPSPDDHIFQEISSENSKSQAPMKPLVRQDNYVEPEENKDNTLKFEPGKDIISKQLLVRNVTESDDKNVNTETGSPNISNSNGNTKESSKTENTKNAEKKENVTGAENNRNSKNGNEETVSTEYKTLNAQNNSTNFKVSSTTNNGTAEKLSAHYFSRYKNQPVLEGDDIQKSSFPEIEDRRREMEGKICLQICNIPIKSQKLYVSVIKNVSKLNSNTRYNRIIKEIC